MSPRAQHETLSDFRTGLLIYTEALRGVIWLHRCRTNRTTCSSRMSCPIALPNFATVSWGLGDRLAQACSVRRRMLPPNSEYLPAQTRTDSRSRGVLE